MSAAADRRGFLKIAAAAVAASTSRSTLAAAPQDEAAAPAGIDVTQIQAAEKLLGLEFTATERGQMVQPLLQNRAIYAMLRQAGLENDEGPAEAFDPRLPGTRLPTASHSTRLATPTSTSLPTENADIAFASLAQLGAWLRSGAISSTRLTEIYLARLEEIGPRLECTITLTRELARSQARRADEELAAGTDHGPLHGIPWGAKDLFDTKGIATTYGAEPFRDRVPDRNAAVVARLEAAGAVLVAKLSLGALAYGDIWFGGVTKNPFKLDQGSSGSSAGSAAATAAGLVGFSLGTETYGSIGSPSARCGAAGLRPTFGRVSRYGAMALCWSLDKVGPICRSAEDCALVLDAINGFDPRDDGSIDAPLATDLLLPIEGARIGYFLKEYERAGAADKEALAALESLGATLVPLEVPTDDFSSLIWITIGVESAAAFERLTLENQDDQLKWQADEAWPNTFRAARFLPAVEFQQVRRLRRRAMNVAAALFEGVDAITAPQRHGAMHALTNLTGHPALTIRLAFRDDGTPRATTLWAPLFQDSKLLAIGHALERILGLWTKRPALT